MGRIYANDKKTVHPKPVGVDGPGYYYWVCPACVKDLTKLFEWVVVEEA